MSIQSVRLELEEMIVAAERKKKDLESLLGSLKELVVKLDGMPPEVVELLMGPVRQKVAEDPDDVGGQTLQVRTTMFERLVSFFIQRKNKVASIGRISRELNMKRNALSTVMYRTHKESFTSCPVEGSKKLRTWRLSDDFWEQQRHLGKHA